MKRKKKKIRRKFLPEILTSAADKIKDDFLKFLFLTTIVLVLGSTGVAVSYGCWGGILLLALIMLFILVALYLHGRYFKK